MTMFRPRNAMLASKLRLMARDADSEAMLSFLRSLSNADFRAAGVVMAEDVLVSACSDVGFWHLFANVVSASPKAFLGTFLKAAVKRYRAGSLTLNRDVEPLCRFACQASAIDCKKVFEAFLPVLRKGCEVDCLLALFGPEDAEGRMALLLNFDTRPTTYVLFQELRKADMDAPSVRALALKLMQKGTRLSFRLAAIVQDYFGLEPLPGQLSLHLKPYELSQLERSESSFLKILG